MNTFVNLCTLIAFALANFVSTINTQFTDGKLLTGFPTRYTVPATNSTWTTRLLGTSPIPGSPRPEGLAPVYDPKDVVLDCGTNTNHWALTYDDGPGPYESVILNHLNMKKIKASFFSVGSSIVYYSGSGRSIYNANHTMHMHSWSHPWLTNLTNAQIVSEIVWSARAIYTVTGKVSRLIRPPYSDVDKRVITILKRMGLVILLWNQDTLDYTLNDNSVSECSVLGDVEDMIKADNPNGVISLQHDLFEKTAAIVPIVNTKIINSKKYSMRSIESCISGKGITSTYVTSGTFYNIVTGKA